MLGTALIVDTWRFKPNKFIGSFVPKVLATGWPANIGMSGMYPIPSQPAFEPNLKRARSLWVGVPPL